QCIAILEKLAVDHPQNLQIGATLSYRYSYFAEFLRLRGNGQSSLEWLGRAIQLLRALARRDPRNAEVGRTWLWKSIGARGETFMRLGRHTEALADFEEVLELTHGTKNEELFQAYCALTKARLGDLSALATLVDRILVAQEALAEKEGAVGYNYTALLQSVWV